MSLTIGKGRVGIHDIKRLSIGYLGVIQERTQKSFHSLLDNRLQFAHSLSRVERVQRTSTQLVKAVVDGSKRAFCRSLGSCESSWVRNTGTGGTGLFDC